MHRAVDPLRLPHPGTRLRRIYDAFLTGEEVTYAWMAEICRGYNSAARATRDLTDYYSCEIRTVRRGVYRMVGRWDGADFIPVDRLAVMDAG